ncbi:MAG TPA: class I SAM-dependent methyltransferase [Bacteroidales bacterium]|nr:class I SAM-dependent methyltransferase [Bacteroidales bacterium]
MEKESGSVESFDTIWFAAKDDLLNETPIKPSIFSWSLKLQTQYFIAERIKFLEKIFSMFPSGKILNCGCGTGQWSIPFAQAGYRVTNLDLSDNALIIVKKMFEKKNLTGEFVKGDILNMPFENETFDIIVSFGVLEHFSNIDQPISEMIRVLKPGGIFFADVIPKRFSVQSVETCWKTSIAVIKDLIKFRFKLIPQRFKELKPPFYENTLSAYEYADSIKRLGCTNIRVFGVRGFPFLILPLIIERLYVGFLKLISPLLRWFDTSSSKFSLFWGVIFSFTAIKECKNNYNNE